MRRSGSSSCILRPRNSLSSEDLKLQDDKMTVTVITSKRLQPYSVERYYMLSEIEENAKSVIFLDSIESKIHSKEDIDITDEHSTDSESKSQIPPSSSEFVILYLLWELNIYCSPVAFSNAVELHVERVLEYFGESLDGSSSQPNSPNRKSSTAGNKSCVPKLKTRIHVVIDKQYSKRDSHPQFYEGNDFFTSESNPSASIPGNTSNITEESYHLSKTKAVEELARSLASSKRLRSVLDGITLGVTNEARAAPALESILYSVTFGAAERRRLSKYIKKNDKVLPDSNSSSTYSNGQYTVHNDINPNLGRSSIHVVALSAEEMMGLDPVRETDAVQGILQTITLAEWNGNGNYKSFAERAHKAWKKEHAVDAIDEKDLIEDEASTLMVITFMICVVSYL